MQVICDQCQKAIQLEEDDVVKEQQVNIGTRTFTLVYFVCPKCRTIYKVQLKDVRYMNLLADVEDVKRRIRCNVGNKDTTVQVKLAKLVDAKFRKLKRYVDSLDKKYDGTFTFATSVNNGKETIVYRPRE